MFNPTISGLVAISSFRALDECAEVAANQLRAKRSWDLVFDRIYLFGDYDRRLSTTSTIFVTSEDFPHISPMVWIAANQTCPACILNADIVVAPNLKELLNVGWQKNMLAMTSQRLEFDPKTEDYFRARVVDLGADFFCAMPDIWKMAYKEIPKGFRIGHQRWDNWMLNFFWYHLHRRFCDITTLGPIFHPKHGSRKMPHTIQVPGANFYHEVGFPPALT